MLRARALSVCVIFLLAMTEPLPADHPATPRLFPEDTVAFVRVVDVETFKKQFRQTAVGQMLRDSSVQPTLLQLWTQVKKAVSPLETRLGATIEEILTIPQGEIALGIVPVPLTEPAFVLIADLGKRPEILRGLMEQAEQAMLARGSDFRTQDFGGTEASVFKTVRGEKTQRLIFFERDDAICVCSHEHAVEQIIQNWNGDDEAKPLASRATYRSTMRHVRSNDSHKPQVYLFADVIGFARAATRGNFAANSGLAMLPMLGLDNLKSLGVSWTLVHDDFDSLIHAHVLLDSPRKGVLDMVALEETKLEPEPWVPRDSLKYTSFTWNVPQTLSASDEMLALIQGEGAMQRWLEETFSEPLGIDIEKEFLEELTGRFIRVQWMEPPLTINSQASVLAAEFRDAERFQATWDKVVERFSERIKPQRIGNLITYKVDRPQPDEDDEQQQLRRRRRRRRGPGMPPDATFAIMGDYFFFADRPGIMRKLLETEDFRDSLSKSKAFDEATDIALGLRGGKHAGMFTFFDAEWVYRHRYALVTAPENQQIIADRFGNNEFIQNLLRTLHDFPLPPFETLQRYVGQTGASVIADEESGWHYTSFLLKRKADRKTD